jgi:hypothetical protein
MAAETGRTSDEQDLAHSTAPIETHRSYQRLHFLKQPYSSQIFNAVDFSHQIGGLSGGNSKRDSAS